MSVGGSRGGSQTGIKMSARREFRIKGGARCRREGLEEAFIGGLRCKVAAFSGSKLLSKDVG